MSDLDRRTFIGGSLGALAASAAVKAQSTTPPSEQFHFALIGAGGQGCHVSYLLNEFPEARLTAICEINPLHAKNVSQAVPDVKVYEDWNEMIAKEKDLQAVVIGLPEHTHAAAAIAALDAGLHVFCEKPMAYSLEETRAMIAARDRSGRVLQIGQQRRSNPLYYLAERLIRKDGVIGEIIRIDAFWDRSADWKRPVPEIDKDFSKWGFPTTNHLINWRLFREYGHGLMTENGTHQMDAASWMLGGAKAKRVCGEGAVRYDDDRETYDVCTADYMFDGDVIVRFSQDFHQGFNYQWSYGELMLGNEGALRITAEQEIVAYDTNRRPRRIPIAKLGDDFQIAGLACPQSDLQAAEDDRAGGGLRTYSYRNEMRIFSHCVRNNAKPACTGEIGHNSVAFTIVGAKAQYDTEYQTFGEGTFL